MRITDAKFSSVNRLLGISEVTPGQNIWTDDPIRMFLDDYESGVELIILSDPHPGCSEVAEYGDFIREIIHRVRPDNLLLEAAPTNGEPLDLSLFPHLVQATDDAYSLGINVHGFDNRRADQSLLKSDPAFEEDAYKRIVEKARNGRTLVIVGSVHATKHPSLSKLGKLLSDRSGLKVKTYLSLVGWQKGFLEESEITQKLNGSGVELLAIPDISSTKLGGLRFLRWKLQMQFKDLLPRARDTSIGEWLDITCGDYDGLLYFKDGDVIKRYLGSLQ